MAGTLDYPEIGPHRAVVLILLVTILSLFATFVTQGQADSFYKTLHVGLLVLIGRALVTRLGRQAKDFTMADGDEVRLTWERQFQDV